MDAVTNPNGDSADTALASVTLMLLAAGVGRRFGGLKQLEPVGPRGEAILEYTTHDAIRAGAERVVLVVRPETEAEFRQSIGCRIEQCADVTYVHQRLDESPIVSRPTVNRRKPWGTGHAVLAAAESVRGPIVVANADDFYGAGAIAAAVEHLKRGSADDADAHALIAYRLRDTLPEAGGVSRAVCRLNADAMLADIDELPEVRRDGGDIVALDAAGRRNALTGDEWVSMNLWAFRPGLRSLLRAAFDQFLHDHADSPDAEFQIPVVIRSLVHSGQAQVRVIPWTGPWCGVTHRDDLVAIRKHIAALTNAGAYPSPVDANRPGISFRVHRSIVNMFGTDGDLDSIAPMPGGHIHASYIAALHTADGPRRFVLQRINTDIFKDPAGLMDNLARVTDHIRRSRSWSGPTELERCVLVYEPTRAGPLFHREPDGSCWRMCRFIERSTSIEFPRTPADAERAGQAFGEFHAMLADLSSQMLHETIPHFHDTPRRLAALEQAIPADSHHRACAARVEIEFALSRRSLSDELIKPLRRRELPMRIAHNDAKLSNVLFDIDSDEPLCIVDLDTVMPGTVLFDFGDMMRTMMFPAAEDEPDHSRVRIDPALFEGLARGFLAATRDFLTPAERDRLVLAGMVIAYEQGIRFLTDYLLGDSYYRTARPGQNLDRCRVQFKLLQEIERHRGDFETVIEKSRARR